ncbi:hypothetical protein ACFOUV_06695 [Oceanobacillus longus]|uniref:Uncharacterized protein n=1 Tax=Oceanobacillus longus TaxID=930120 RepID=A0ABV8GXB0_9BACI
MLCEGRLHGIGHLYESALQLRGQAEKCQLPDVNNGVIAVGGYNSKGLFALQNLENIKV